MKVCITSEPVKNNEFKFYNLGSDGVGFGYTSLLARSGTGTCYGRIDRYGTVLGTKLISPFESSGNPLYAYANSSPTNALKVNFTG